MTTQKKRKPVTPTTFKSEAHRNKMQALLGAGKITQAQFDTMHNATGKASLPPRVSSNQPVKRKTRP